MIEITNIELKRVDGQTVLQIEAGQDIFQMDLILPDDQLAQLAGQFQKMRLCPTHSGPFPMTATSCCFHQTKVHVTDNGSKPLSVTKSKASCPKCPGRNYPSGKAHFQQCDECKAKS